MTEPAPRAAADEPHDAPSDAPADAAADDTGRRLAALGAYRVLDADPDDPIHRDLEAAAELAANVLAVPTAVINLIDDRLQRPAACVGYDAVPVPRRESMCRTVLDGGTDVLLADARSDPRFADSPFVDGTIARARLYCSMILRNPDGVAFGTLCVFDDRVHEIPDRAARSLRIVADQVVDVLELRLRNRQLQDSNVELLRSQDRLTAFAGQISHDLKAPITAILGFTELLEDLDTVDGDPVVRTYVGRCTSAAGRMLDMVNEMLAYARIGATLDRRDVALDTVVAEVREDLAASIDGAQIRCAGPDVPADPAQLRALVQNLVGNALTYRGERPCVVDIRTERTDGGVVLRVADNGPGIPADSRAEVLRPLVRLRGGPGAEKSGTGLGLAVCVRVMNAHGGTLALQDSPGGGTTVVCTFPE